MADVAHSVRIDVKESSARSLLERSLGILGLRIRHWL